MVEVLNELAKWVLYFFIYSIVGWIFESLYCSIKAKPIRFINRGFLFGPLCPIYGSAIVAIAFLMQPFHFEIWQEFIFIAVVCSVIEYIASFVMEKLYHVRWWCYKNSWYNVTLNGRISLWTSIGFGIGGTIIVNYLHPHIVDFVDSFSFSVRMALTVSLIIIFILDNYMSNAAASSVKHALKGGKVDLTDEIKRYAINYYRTQTRRTRRIARALLRKMKQAQKFSVRQLKKTQKQIIKAAKKARKDSIMRQKRIEAKLDIRKQLKENRKAYLSKRHEVRKEIAMIDIRTIPWKSEILKKLSKFDLTKKK